MSAGGFQKTVEHVRNGAIPIERKSGTAAPNSPAPLKRSHSETKEGFENVHERTFSEILNTTYFLPN